MTRNAPLEGMKRSTGIVFRVREENRAYDLAERLSADASRGFTDSVSSSDFPMHREQIAFLSLDSECLDYLAIASRGRSTATRKRQIRFRGAIRIEPPLAFAEVRDALPSHLQPHLDRSIKGIGGRVPPRTWEALVSAIRRLRPDLSEGLDRLNQESHPRSQELSDGELILRHEQDAVRSALHAAGVARTHLNEWSAPYPLAPFLLGLPESTATEDEMIVHDAQVFGDWSRLAPFEVGRAQFTNSTGSVLTIKNVNRHPLESTLGVDLIYYHNLYDSYVLVQYKRMTPCKDSDFEFRPGGKSYERELQRMSGLDRQFGGTKCMGAVEGYRLDSSPFYFKLCPDLLDGPTGSLLVDGMYFPLEYWKRLMSDARVRGPRGGIRVTRKGAERWIENALFVRLLRSGWIGSRPRDSATITSLIQDSLGRQRSVILAAQSSSASHLRAERRS
ncbi:MAG: hypothetical protein DHS20C21_00640 [Gemmatimonadota bacterium]|nr:MAG: hypothetical protein DHS20C21_00640 [Gemmatimonadota bacterium]